MNLKIIEVKEKEVLETDQMEKEYVYIVKTSFPTNKIIFDYYLLIYYNFFYRFKIYRCYIDTLKNTFNFHLKVRDLRAVKELMKK